MDIELADAVAALRDELLEAVGRGCDHDIAFEVGPIELEFAVELRADVRAKAGFKAWILASAEVEAGASGGRQHRVSVTLTPKDAGGKDLLISARSTGSATPADVTPHIGR